MQDLASRCGGVAALAWLTCEVEQQQGGQAGGEELHHPGTLDALARPRDARPRVSGSQQLARKSTPFDGWVSTVMLASRVLFPFSLESAPSVARKIK